MNKMKIVFNEFYKMNAFITTLKVLIDTDGYITLKRVKDLTFSTKTVKDTDSVYGWKDDIEFKAIQSEEYNSCWELILPEPVLLFDNCINITGHINGMPISRYIAANLLQYSSLKGEKYYASEDELSEIINNIMESILVIQKEGGQDGQTKTK